MPEHYRQFHTLINLHGSYTRIKLNKKCIHPSLEGTHGIYNEKKDQTGSILYKAEVGPSQKKKICLILASNDN